MAHAFVIDWNPRAYNCPVIVGCGYGYDRTFYSIQEKRRNRSYFTFKSNHNLNVCYYLVNSAYEAKVLARLLNQVSNFQIHSHVYDTFDKHVQKNGYKNIACMLSEEKELIEHFGDETGCYYKNTYVYNYDKNDIPFNICEIDTKQPLNLGPCFFYEQYKMHDENGHPLYLAVVFERQNNGTEDEDLFNYHIKFIGSGQPLPKQWCSVSTRAYDGDVELYNQKVEAYKRKHAEDYQDKANYIKHQISDPDYKNNFETYKYETNEHWQTCAPVIDGFHCNDYYYMKYGYCYRRHCPHYRGWTHDIETHDGRAVYDRFLALFGPEITELVKNGKFREEHWHMMPDFSDPAFIKKLNTYNGYSTLHFFDDGGNIKNRQNHLNSDLAHIKNWAKHSDFNILRYKTHDGSIQTISSLPEKSEFQNEYPDEEDSGIYPTDFKTRLLWSNMGRIKFPAIYMKSPGTTRIINSDIGAAYDFVDEDAGIYYDYTETYVNYKKTKSKDELETTYKFPYPWKDLGYGLEYLMDDMRDMQQSGNLRWAPSKLFSKEKSDGVIEVLRANVDYNGITVLNPQKMSQIKCDHYEIRESRYDSYFLVLSRDQKGQVSDGITCYLKNILLFNKAGQVSGVIHTDYVDEILPHIIAKNQAKQM